MRPNKRATRRGYLLLEVMMGGAIIATGLLVSANAVSHMRQESEQSAREATAAQLLSEKVEYVRSLDYSALGGITTYAPGSPEAITLGGSYTRSFTRTLVSAVTGPPPIPAYYEFTVIVEYVVRSKIMQTSTTFRIYDPN